jgi:hypothetical protein
MSEPLAKALREIKEADWRTFGDPERDGTLRQWAEVDFVPGEKSEHKDRQPLRYADCVYSSRKECCSRTEATGIFMRC